MIIAAYAGTGKTTLANMYPDKFTDFVCMPYKYELEESDGDGEACKANPDNFMRPEWPYNYIDAIMENMDAGKHLLIPSDHFVLTHLQIKGVPYVLCYPQRDAKDAYRKRYIDRGNNERFLEIFSDRWDNWMNFFEEDAYGHHIILRPDEFLSDIAERIEELQNSPPL